MDDIFVFTDQFKIARGGSDLTPRMQRTFNVASKAMFTTSCTTFISFISNAKSVFPAVSTFGLFSALLVFVNFCAVTIFFPAVLAVYRTFVREKWWDHPSLLFCCKKEVPEEPEFEHGHDEATGFNKFFKDTWAPLILKFRYIILAFFFAVFVFALTLTVANLEPDEEAPITIPDGNNYKEYTDVLLGYFQKSGNPAATRVRWVSGIDPDKPIDRSGTDETNLTDYGAAVYLSCESFNPTTPAAQVWSLQTCHDMFFSNVTGYHTGSDDFGPDGSNGNKARNMVNSIVKEDEVSYYSKVKCVAQGFRDWLLTDGGVSTLLTPSRIIWTLPFTCLTLVSNRSVWRFRNLVYHAMLRLLLAKDVRPGILRTLASHSLSLPPVGCILLLPSFKTLHLILRHRPRTLTSSQSLCLLLTISPMRASRSNRTTLAVRVTWKLQVKI